MITYDKYMMNIHVVYIMYIGGYYDNHWVDNHMYIYVYIYMYVYIYIYISSIMPLTHHIINHLQYMVNYQLLVFYIKNLYIHN